MGHPYANAGAPFAHWAGRASFFLRLLIARMLGLVVLCCLTGCPGTHKSSDPPPGPAMPAVPNGIAFEDVAKSSGVIYTWPTQPKPMRNIEAFGRGCAFLDYDDDGWQ